MNNKIKTILFGALIAAMILPFSGMIMADATPNETERNLTEQHKADRKQMVEMGYDLEKSFTTPNESRDSMLAKGYELSSAGWLHKDRIQADPVWMDHPNGSGEKILDGNAMKKQYDQLMRDATPEQLRLTASLKHNFTAHGERQVYPGTFNTDVQTSYEIAVKDNLENDFTYSMAFWTVPESPANYNEGTNFNFNALQPSLANSLDTILQPVLQHGYSNICGEIGDNWATHPFIMVLGYKFESDCIPANEGDLIRGTISKDPEYDVWSVSIRNYNNAEATDTVSISTNLIMHTAFTAVETWNIPENCTELQGDVEYRMIRTVGDVAEDDWVARSGHPTFCGMSTSVIDDSNVQLNNDN